MIGWTTVDSEVAAQKLAQGLIEARLAACVQMDPPMTAWFRWEGQVDTATEWRLWVKFPAAKAPDIQAFLQKAHPYDTPQWLAVSAASVSPGYHQWAIETTQA